MWMAKPRQSAGREHPLDRHVRLAAGLDLQNVARPRVCRWQVAGGVALVAALGLLGWMAAQALFWWG